MEIENLKLLGQKLMSAVVPSTSSSDDIQNYHTESKKRLDALEKSVEQCKYNFGGKTILATDDDLYVKNMCNQWVNVMTHGLKVPVSTYQPIQNIITAGLNYAFNLNLYDVSLWDYTRVHLTRHEEERYKLLKNINTPIGHFKAFLRSALNERSLERYLGSWISHNLINEYYEDWALVKNPDLTKRLLNFAKDLTTILFAMAIDKPELNEPVNSTQQINNVSEPVIAITKPITKNVNKKTLRQVISFDNIEQKNTDMTLSAENPKPDIINHDALKKSISLNSNDSSSDNSAVNKFCNINLNDGSDKLTKESSKESLTKLEEMKDSFSSNFYSDSLSHPDSDLSSNSGDKKRSECGDDETNSGIAENTVKNILSNITQQNSLLNNRIAQLENVLEDKITEILNLNSENKRLKDQLNHYMSAVQDLDRDTDDNEVKQYEKKLVAVAQMHAELMEFNNMLQQQLNQNMTNCAFPGISNNSSEVNILIPSTYLVSKESKTFHVYQVFLKIRSEEWNIYRRYSEFRKFYQELKNSHPSISSFVFPPKKVLGKKEAWLVEQRRNQLQAWLQHVVNVLPQLHQCRKRVDVITLMPFFGNAGYSEHSGVLIPINT